MNDVVFNTQVSPLYALADMTLSNSLIGKAFISNSAQTVSSGQSMILRLSNPTSSNIRAVIDMGMASVNTSTLTLVTVLLDPTVSISTTPVSPVVLNTAYVGTSPVCTTVVGVGTTPVYSGGTIIQQLYVQGTTVFSPTDFVLTANHSVAVVFSPAGSSVQAIRWYEIPPTAFPS